MKRAKVTEARQQAAIAEKKTLLRNVDEADGLKLHPGLGLGQKRAAGGAPKA